MMENNSFVHLSESSYANVFNFITIFGYEIALKAVPIPTSLYCQNFDKNGPGIKKKIQRLV